MSVVKKVEVKIHTSKTSQTNPYPPKQTQTNPPNSLQANKYTLDQLYQLLQQLQQPNQQQNKGIQYNEFIVKSGMKASIVALKTGQLLTVNKEVTLSALGYAVPILLDSLFLIRKDFAKMGKLVELQNVELIEKQFSTKTVSGIKVKLVLK